MCDWVCVPQVYQLANFQHHRIMTACAQFGQEKKEGMYCMCMSLCLRVSVCQRERVRGMCACGGCGVVCLHLRCSTSDRVLIYKLVAILEEFGRKI